MDKRTDGWMDVAYLHKAFFLFYKEYLKSDLHTGEVTFHLFITLVHLYGECSIHFVRLFSGVSNTLMLLDSCLPPHILDVFYYSPFKKMDIDFTVLHFELLSFWNLPTVWHSKQNIFQKLPLSSIR
jgi:hypothetical protein